MYCRFRVRRKAWLFVALGAAVLAALAVADQTATVQRVVDGDTFVLTTGEKVRMIGIDSPEEYDPDKPVEYFSKEAQQALDSMIGGKQVSLAFGPERKDKYGRLLCYVYLPDSTLVNLEMIKGGYALAYLRFPHKLEDQFVKAEIVARKAAIGMWASPRSRTLHDIYKDHMTADSSSRAAALQIIEKTQPSVKADTVYITRTGAKYHRAGCSSLRKSMISITRKDAIARGYEPCGRCRP